jgi:hypothetical protein
MHRPMRNPCVGQRVEALPEGPEVVKSMLTATLRSGSIACAAVVVTAGCASAIHDASPAAPSTAPTSYTITGSPTPPTTPGPITTPGDETSFWSPPPAATSAIGCQSGAVAIGNVWYAPDSYLCLHAGSTVSVTLFSYPSGWSPLVVAPAGAAKVTALKTNPDGSQAATISVRKTGTFTVSTDSLDNLAPSASWTLHVTVHP